MKTMPFGRAAAIFAVSLVAAGAFAADELVPALQDLMGAKGTSAESALTSRGYAYLGPGHGVRSDFRYWREPKTRNCVGVQFTENRVTAVFYTQSAQCERAAANKPKVPEPSTTGFSTVCGVTVDGKPYRYKCTVEGATPGTTGQTTTLHFPDNAVTFKWLGGNGASATFEGMNPRDVQRDDDRGHDPVPVRR